ncbi:hypothetical protein [Microvirga guangxiensis]|uniref:Uncharacterized protein n=1 Tax=Microvirga guangxiensis TaxID=549386 RepID=A0A1G5L959_9HYPH|nr:hypothetical protein [Microvirga guangxiensis]SCZ08868.1 hypothetical protein SAMN02927923_04000 [Microvirga guangxiensis]
MNARNPEDSPEEDVRKKGLRIVNDEMRGPSLPQHQGAPVVPQACQDKAPDTKVELDRVEIYLKGPTVFTA